MMTIYNNRNFLLITFIVLVIILGGFIFAFSQNMNQGSTDFSISSANANPGYNGITNAYSLNISLQIVFHQQVHFNEYAALSVCSFDLKLNSSTWKAIPIYCTLPTSASETFSGSHNFTLTFGIEPVANTKVPVPFDLSFMVYSSQFNVTSQPYTLKVNSSNYESLKLTQASLNKFTQQDGSTGYNINTTFYLTSDHSFNVTYGCTSPFTVSLVDNSTWHLTRVDCLAIFTHYLPSGISEYSLSYQLIDPNGQGYNYTTPFPSNFYVQVTLGNNLLNSNVYTLVT